MLFRSHHLLYVDENKDVYLIDDNKVVKYTGYKHNDKSSIFDCELYYNNSSKKYELYIFDCLFYAGKDYRKQSLMVQYDSPIKNANNANNIIQKDMMQNQNQYQYGDQTLVKITEEYVGTRFGYIEKFMTTPPSSEYNSILSIFIKYYINSTKNIYDKCNVAYNFMESKKFIDMNIETDGLIIAKYSDPYPTNSLVFDHIYKYKPLDKLSIDLLVLIDLNKKITNGADECRQVKLIASSQIGRAHV